MASFKPTKVQFLPKLGEKVTEDTLYWKNYKVWEVLTHNVFSTSKDFVYHLCVQWKVYILGVLISQHFNKFFSIYMHWQSAYVFQSPVQMKEFGAVTKIDFSPLTPHNYAVTASTRVSPFIIILFHIEICMYLFIGWV